jgi:hypothetical protein
VDLSFKKLEGDPRYKAFLKKMNLPELGRGREVMFRAGVHPSMEPREKLRVFHTPSHDLANPPRALGRPSWDARAGYDGDPGTRKSGWVYDRMVGRCDLRDAVIFRGAVSRGEWWQWRVAYIPVDPIPRRGGCVTGWSSS